MRDIHRPQLRLEAPVYVSSVVPGTTQDVSNQLSVVILKLACNICITHPCNTLWEVTGIIQSEAIVKSPAVEGVSCQETNNAYVS